MSRRWRALAHTARSHRRSSCTKVISIFVEKTTIRDTSKRHARYMHNACKIHGIRILIETPVTPSQATTDDVLVRLRFDNVQTEQLWTRVGLHVACVGHCVGSRLKSRLLHPFTV